MELQERLCDAAFRLFTTMGYHGVTMERIARSCGVGKATVYQLFPSKEALFLASTDYFSAKIGGEIAAVVNDHTRSPQQKMELFLEPVVRFLSGVNGDVLSDLQRSLPEAYEKIEYNRRKIILSSILNIVEEGKAGGIFRKDLNGTLVAHILMGAVTHMSERRVQEEMGLSAVELFQRTMSVIWQGCLREKANE